jgi:hypothetical protein
MTSEEDMRFGTKRCIQLVWRMQDPAVTFQTGTMTRRLVVHSIHDMSYNVTKPKNSNNLIYVH